MGYGRPKYEEIEEQVDMEELQKVIEENNRQNEVINQIGGNLQAISKDIKFLGDQINNLKK